MKISQIVKNKVLLYLVSRYATYGIQFITSIVIASKLGPFYFGIWGFILLMMNYLGQLNFGIDKSMNVLLVQNKDDMYQSRTCVTNSFFLATLLALVILLVYVYYWLFGVQIVDDYHAGKYVFPVCIIAILQNYNGLFVNLFRVKNRLNSISVTQSLIVLFPFLTCFFFNGERLLEALVLSNLISFAACVVYSITSGVANRPSRNEVSLSCMKVILSKGILLFLYNSCFYFIILSIRTIVSDNYSIEDFGYFTFAFTLGNAILSLLDAVSFVVFPKVLSLFNSSDLVGVRRALVKIRSIYMISAHILVYFFILSMPLLTYVMPDYAQSVTAFNLIALALLMKSNSYAHSSLLVAKNKEGLSAIISAVGLVVNIAVGMILVKVFRVTFNYVAIATLLSYLVISAWTYIKGEIMLIGSMSLMEFVKDYFPLTLLIPYIVALIVTTLDLYWLFWLPLALVLVLNIKGIVSMIGFIRNILVKPDIINI